mmetsp:Transcript_24387/g.29774  ORF Transcript_24387/g.29774 Transcript_24387/m.29774 type:complete len:444 (+) Transcript_24387:176-1507(+)
METAAYFAGFVVGDRTLGKRLRFIDLFPISAPTLLPVLASEIHPAEVKDCIDPALAIASKNGATPPSELVHLVFVNNETFDHSYSPFPETVKELRKGDKISVKSIHWEEKLGKVNMGKRPNSDSLKRNSSSLYRKVLNYYVKSWELLERPPEGKDVVKCLTESRSGMDNVLCKTWVFKGHCPNKTCSYRHFLLNENEQRRVKARITQQKQDKATGAMDVARYRENDIKEPHTDKYMESGHGAANDQDKKMRSKLFARWLLEVFGRETVEGGSGLLDIAGGKGYVSMQLLYETKSSNMKTTIVDPLPRKTVISRRHRKAFKKLNLNPPQFIHVCFDNKFVQHPEYGHLLKEASLIVGMHPDEATGSIVEIALQQKKPFAVVPCCVFTNKFPERKTSTGKRVETLNELIDWLKLKSQSRGHIKTALLPMGGRNKILYMRQQDYFV